VQLFFVLSAFLLFLPYARWIFGLQERPSARMFYRRRALRVGPAYWVTLVILVLAGPLTLAALADGLIHVFFLSNVSRATAESINPVFWTMAVEVQFYVILPAIGWCAYTLTRRLGPARAMLLVSAGLAAISLVSDSLDHVLRFQQVPMFGPLLLGQYSMPDYLAVFGAGIACSAVYTYARQVAPLRGAPTRGYSAAGRVALPAGVGLALLVVFVPSRHLPLEGTLMGCAYAAILFGVLFGPAIWRAPFESPILRFVGLISYSVYLWHSIAMSALDNVLPVPTHTTIAQVVLLRFVLGTPLSLAVAYVSYQLTERPFIHARKQAHDAPGSPEGAPARAIGALGGGHDETREGQVAAGALPTAATQPG
jgi:peptidoglycan/LPS O-acetylase OafA/YrhL